jgi:hypothetical protein
MVFIVGFAFYRLDLVNGLCDIARLDPGSKGANPRVSVHIRSKTEMSIRAGRLR